MANIFVVDDEPLLLELMSNVLRLEGHEVSAFSNPLAAVEFFRTGQPSINLLLTDVQMQPIDGTEVANRLIQMGFNGPIIFTSGYPSFDDPSPGSAVRLSLDKPFTASDLRAVVGSALGSSLPQTRHAG